jgi:hypothetical protein
MTRLTSVEHRFVDLVPRDLDPAVVYVSFEYTTVAHLCCCGCGKRVVLPLSPAQWEIAFDGETISVWPSVGNWDLDCRSHYVIDRNRVQWAKQWTDDRIDAGRRADARALDRRLSSGSDDGPSAADRRAGRSRLARLRRLARSMIRRRRSP